MLGHFLSIIFFLYVTNTEAKQQKSEKSPLGSATGYEKYREKISPCQNAQKINSRYKKIALMYLQ
jgi:hypothetical protein